MARSRLRNVLPLSVKGNYSDLASRRLVKVCLVSMPGLTPNSDGKLSFEMYPVEKHTIGKKQ